MRIVLTSAVLFAATLLFLGGSQAGEKEEKTFKGSITCAKCDLGKEKKCMTVIVTKGKDDKQLVLYFDPASHKKHHAKVCTEAHDGTVTGTVSKEGDKYLIKVKSVEFKE